MKKPTRLESTAVLPSRAKRVQLVAWVAPLTKVPNTRVMAMCMLMLSLGTMASRPSSPPTSRVASQSDHTSSASMAGTATRDSMSSPL